MNSDPVTPPPKRRKVAEVRVPPARLSDLLAAFGARSAPMSARRMEKHPDDHNLRPIKKETVFSYAESPGSGTATPSPGKDSFQSPESSRTSNPDHSDGNEDSDEDTIQVAQRPPTSIRSLPERSTRSKISYASPKRPIKKKKPSKNRKSLPAIKLTSDLDINSKTRNPELETARNKVRLDIAEFTKPKRDAFLLANKELFFPLLPENSYIDKLQRLRDMNDGDEACIVPYVELTSQPKAVQAKMKPYQLEGLSYLIYMHNNGMSAILGDEMGLGKTLQTLSLFQYLKDKEPVKGEPRPFLVVCPLSVLSSWMNESKKWVPNLSVVRFHGPKIERDKLKEECRVAGKASNIDVIVTTYDTFVAEQGWFKRAFVWRYCVLDEGHKIKNSKSDVSHAFQSLKAEYRLLLTGTPLQNNLTEMWALLHWLFPEVFTIDTADNFKRAFDLTRGKVSSSFMDDARRLLELIMLRRMKSTPGVDLGLPPKEEILLYVPLTPMQRFWYTRFLTKADNSMLDELFKGAKSKEMRALKQEAIEDEQQSTLLKKAEEDLARPHAEDEEVEDVWAESMDIIANAMENEQTETKKGRWQKLMNLIMQLRKICSHPYLIKDARPDPYLLGDHVMKASGKFIVLSKLVDELVLKQKKKILIFSGFTTTLDLCEDLLTMKGANAVVNTTFSYLRLDGSTARARRNLGIRMFNDPESDFKVMLISTRAGGLGINLASASDVVFLDEDWNPQVTLQAEARAHRIGQTQNVTVYKLCTQGTVEEQMMGRIRKKLYLSAKITESMRNIHSSVNQGTNRKRQSSGTALEEEGPHLDTSSLMSLVRRGAQTLSRPEVDVTEMLGWDWQTTLEKCKDNPIDAHVAANGSDVAVDEQRWLNTMEKVECAVFEGQKIQKQIDKEVIETNFTRADRRVGKNTTVMIDGFAINKESLNCADWEAVPTMAGKDPRLAEPVREKKAPINHQEFCQVCWDGGKLVLCGGCPRVYHLNCLDADLKRRAQGFSFHCPQHECVDCQSKTASAGGLMYRCRWCANAYCEDCLDWETVKLIGPTIPEFEMLDFEAKGNMWHIECPSCVKNWEMDKADRAEVTKERKRIEADYKAFLASVDDSGEGISGAANTPATVSEVGTPVDVEFAPPPTKKRKINV